MITRMHVTMRSVKPTGITPKIFSLGSFTAVKEGRKFTFDFTDSEYEFSHDDEGHLNIDILLRNFDEDSFGPQKEIDRLMRRLEKEDFTEIFYECYEDEEEEGEIQMKVLTATFFDFSTNGDGLPIPVMGDEFPTL